MTSEDDIRPSKPRPNEINAVIADMVGVGPLTPGDPDVPLCVPLWYVTAYDPQGNKRGTGIDTTLAGAAAAAWVLEHGQIDLQFRRGTKHAEASALVSVSWQKICSMNVLSTVTRI